MGAPVQLNVACWTGQEQAAKMKLLGLTERRAEHVQQKGAAFCGALYEWAVVMGLCVRKKRQVAWLPQDLQCHATVSQ